jgi:hypothetical protein
VRLVATLVATFVAVAACASPAPTPAPTARPTPVVTPNPHLGDPTTAELVLRGLGTAGLDIVANNADSGSGPLVRRINATYMGWPLSVSEFLTSEDLAEATSWETGESPTQGQPPVTLAGMNILIEWGPTTGAKPKEPAGPQVDGLRELASTLDLLISPLRAKSVVAVPGVRAVTAEASAEASAAANEATPAP